MKSQSGGSQGGSGLMSMAEKMAMGGGSQQGSSGLGGLMSMASKFL